MDTTRITELASIIASKTALIDTHLTAQGLPSPSFDPDSPPQLLNQGSIAEARRIVLEATDELHALIQGPVGLLTTPAVCRPSFSRIFADSLVCWVAQLSDQFTCHIPL